MAKEIIRRNGTTSEHSAFTGAEAEITVDTDKNTVVVHDGVTTGGFALAKEDGSNISDFAITGILSADSAEFNGTGAVELPEGTEAQRPGTPASGMIRLTLTLARLKAITVLSGARLVVAVLLTDFSLRPTAIKLLGQKQATALLRQARLSTLRWVVVS